MSRISIRARLTLAFAAALLLVLAIAGAFVYERVSSDLNSSIDDSLHARANDVAALVAGSGRPSQLGSAAAAGGEEGFSQVLTPGGGLVTTTLAPEVGPVLNPAEAERASRRPLFAGEQGVRGVEAKAKVFARPAASRGRLFVVVAGVSTDDRDETLAGLRDTFLVGTPVAILLASGIGYLLARRSLVPVEAMRRRAQEITLERSGERLPLPHAEDEIRQLGETLNTMLDRIEASLQRERVFVADASHELRTPLAILSAELELADRPERSPGEVREALRSVREEVDRLSQLAESLLLIAGSDDGGVPIARERVQLADLVNRVRERFAARATKSGRVIVVSAPDGAAAELDPLRIEQALGSLVDNALRHGAGEVRLSAGGDGERVEFAVSDQGDGFPSGFEEHAFERFSRADAGRSGGGAGLGLAIARAIAEAHGGTAMIENGKQGTTVRISL